ncbi:hypothetical protein WAI453_009645 [Rhynchosporium graminicola]|uniref:Uncharacterized protein n=1 Tax=Rhynchosporium graminicola TaxID=2792576 RepID=A0A1E1L136_9HELO|nr:uncharacterized protein RCO7_10647 [Rhynchosporium commune]
MDPEDPFGKDPDAIMSQMTRLSLHPILSAYPSKEANSAMRSLIHALQTAQTERIRICADAISTPQRLQARKEEYVRCQRVGDDLKEGEMRSVWQGWMDLLKWEMVVSEVEERLGLVAF